MDAHLIQHCAQAAVPGDDRIRLPKPILASAEAGLPLQITKVDINDYSDFRLPLSSAQAQQPFNQHNANANSSTMAM